MYIKLADLKQFYEMMDIPTVITDLRYEPIWNNSRAGDHAISRSGFVRNAVEASFGADRLLQAGQPSVLLRFEATSRALAITATPVGTYIVVQISNAPTAAPELDSVIEGINGSVDEMLSLLPIAVRSTNGDPIAASSFERVYRSCFSILRTSQNLSVLTKLVNAHELNDDVICVSSLLATVAQSANAICETNPEQVPIIYHEPEEPLYINCDRECFLVAMLNLIYNSMYYTQDDNQIELSCSRIGNRISIRISDSGIGIKPELLNSVIMPFSSTHPCYDDEERPGVGMGLSIAKELAGRYGGTFNIESRVFEGTTVLLSFPSAKPPMELKQPSVSLKSLVVDKMSPLYIQLHKVCALRWD